MNNGTNNTRKAPQAPSERQNRQGNPPPPRQAQGQATGHDKPKPRRTVAPNPQRPPKGLSDNLRSQTPLSRKLQKKTAPTEPGTARRRSAPQQFKVKQKKKSGGKSLSHTAMVVILGLIGYAVLLPIIILSVALALPSHSTPETDDFTYQLGIGKNVYSVKVYGYERVRRGGTYYIEMDSLAEYCNLTTTGNSQRMRYVVRSTGDSIEFVVGESIAYINGVSERTDATVFLKGGKLYVPLSFASRCFNGIDITLDLVKNKITIARQMDDNGEYLEVSFPYKLPDISESINFAELDPEIQNDIIMQNQPQLPENNEEGTASNSQ